MKILTGPRIHEADRATIEREPVASIDLMERAAEALAQWIANHTDPQTPLVFIVGKGNNGGDGLAVARILHHAGYACSIYLAFPAGEMSEECRFNFERLPRGLRAMPLDKLAVPEDAVLVDALLGTGVRGPVRAAEAAVIDLLNSLPNRVVSIDVPSGMLTEFGNAGRPIVRAAHTLAIEFPKLAMLLPEAGECCGSIEIVPIDLDAQFLADASTPYHYVTPELAADLILPRAKFAHKNTYGHALLLAGSEGMMGAALLATGAALRSGCGLVTAHIPASERMASYATNPSAMLSLDPGKCFSQLPADPRRFTAAGVGPGLGMAPETEHALLELLEIATSPMVIDADALNILARRPEMQVHIPAGSILTPHLGELHRLTGAWDGEQDKIARASALARQTRSVIIVKGAHTMICLPDDRVFFNSTGTPGMAKGGSGDVLTGFLTGLIARGYGAPEAAILGVYLHGRAGEKAADYFGEEGMNSADLTDFLSEAYAELAGSPS